MVRRPRAVVSPQAGRLGALLKETVIGLCAAAFLGAPGAANAAAKPGPEHWVCWTTAENVDITSQRLGEKGSGVFGLDAFPDGSCSGSGVWSSGGAYNEDPGYVSTGPLLDCNWQRTDEYGPYAGEIHLLVPAAPNPLRRAYVYFRITEDKEVLARIDPPESPQTVGNVTCERQTYQGRIKKK